MAESRGALAADRMPTMADVAQVAGVSRALVSIVLRGAPGASEQTRARVLKVADEIGYRPHAAARALRRDRSRNLGVVFTPRHPFEVEIVEGVYAAAESRDYRVVLSAMTPTRHLRKAVDELVEYRCEGVLFVGLQSPDAADLTAPRMPAVHIGRSATDFGGDVVRSDDEAGTAEAVEFLVGLGHRRITHVDGGSMPGARERRAGYRAAMKTHGLGRYARVIPGDNTEEGGARAARQLLAGDTLPTAVIAGNDWAAFGVIGTLTQAGLAVPDDLSVVGYDDSRLAQLPFLQLSSVRQDARLMGEMAVRAMDEQLTQARVDSREIVLEPRFVPRGTTARPPADRADEQ